MAGINGECDRPCTLGRPHNLECRNYIEVTLPCPCCWETAGRHQDGCVLAPETEG